jgi:perosamine synthetase
MKFNIPVSEPDISTRDLFHVFRSLKKGEVSGNARESLALFEERFSRYVGCNFGVCTNSGTSAILAALVALKVGPGDEVLVSSYTNMASFFPVIQLGATPVPVDVDEITCNMSPSDLQKAITPKSKVIVVVHIYGQPAPMKEICAIAKQHSLFIIEDCAEAHGATYESKPVGSFGDLACFSFYANKIITTGEGGMVTTNDEVLARHLRSIVSLSYGELNKFVHSDIGYNFRMSNLLASLGLSQLQRIEKMIRARKKCAMEYTKLLINEPRIQLLINNHNCKSVDWVFPIMIRDPETYPVKAIITQMKNFGIECREGFVPFPDQSSVLKKYSMSTRETPVASRVGRSTLYLPLSTKLTPKKQKLVVKYLSQVLDALKDKSS